MRTLRTATLCVTAAFIAPGIVAIGQQPFNLPTPAVDLVTVIPSVSDHTEPLRINGDKLTGTGVTITGIVERLYGVPESAIVGLTEDQSARRYDITAKIDAPDSYSSTAGHLSPREYMLTVLLARHLGITAHTELRTIPVYALKEASAGNALAPVASAAHPINTGIETTSHSIEGHAITLASFANTLGMLVGKSVVDQTGLSGSYNISLNWPPSGTSAIEAISEALQTQLSLQIIPTESPARIVVIDHVERAAK